MKKRLLVVLVILATFGCPSAYAQRTDKQMSNCAWLYTKRDMAMRHLVKRFDSLHFAPGEHIADIGAKGANMAGILSMFYKDLDITLEDIDSSCLNNEQAAYVLRYYSGINDGKQPEGIQVHVVIGNDTSTTLPSGLYKKVFFINTYHEVTKPRQMLADLYRILAPDGILYAQEKLATSKQIIRKDCHHVMPLEKDFLKQFQDAGFKMVKVNVTEHHRKKGDKVKGCWYQFRKKE